MKPSTRRKKDIAFYTACVLTVAGGLGLIFWRSGDQVTFYILFAAFLFMAYSVIEDHSA